MTGPSRLPKPRCRKVNSGAKRRLKPTISRSLPVRATVVEQLVELILGQRERLLDEHRLAALQCLAGELGVRVVTGDHEDSVDGRVVQDYVRVRGRRPESELALRIDGRERPRRCDRGENSRWALHQVRQQHR